jgi:hypothetical protein
MYFIHFKLLKFVLLHRTTFHHFYFYDPKVAFGPTSARDPLGVCKNGAFNLVYELFYHLDRKHKLW